MQNLQATHATIGELAAELKAPQWQIRRIVDQLGEPIPRVGQYRFVPRYLRPKIKAALPRKEGTCA